MIRKLLKEAFALIPRWMKAAWIPILAVCTGLMIFIALLQTTLLAQFRPFGATPDLMILFVLAVGMRENEKWGAVFGILSALIIDALGGTGVTLLPILYFAVGYLFPVIAVEYLTNSISVRALFTLCTVIGKMSVSFVTALVLLPDESIIVLLRYLVLPEAAGTLLMALPVELFVRLCLRPFHRTRAERVSDLQLF